ncbi:amino acid adenylation domain-containing protein [Streptosporangium sp. NPDC020072]|uniref:amino acid adenylation domain-containing protein n=1 Tax=Streptosporangium sp. NPDC020072 TaxID=3154788 RepID=UPI003431E64A
MEEWPLLSAQLRTWMAQSSDLTDPTNCITDCLEIHGPVDPAVMRAANERVEHEAEALRLRLVSTEDGYRQYVDPAGNAPLVYLDLSAEADPVAEADAWMQADMRRPIDPLRLCGAALLRTAADRFVLYRRVHHAVVDGWSLALIHNRLAAVYTALAEGRASEDGAFPAFQELLSSEKQYEESRRFETDHAYWLSRFADRPDPVRLAGRSSSAVRIAHRRRADLGPARIAGLRAAADRFGVSWSDLATGITAAYVGRMTNADEVVLGIPAMARMTPQVRRVPGMTTNGLPVRVPMVPGTSVADFARQVSLELRQTLKHSRYPSAELARETGLLGTGRRLWGQVVNVMDFDYALDFAGATATVRTISLSAADDLSVTFYRTSADDTFELIVDAHPEIHSVEETEAHLRRFLFFLDSLVLEEPGTPVHEVPLVDPAERARLREWGTGPVHEIPPTAVHELVEAWAARTARAPAIEFEDTVLSFAEVNERANRLARHLLSLGAGPGQIVAFALPRSADLHITALSVLKTGAAFLPLDPAYPAARLSFMVGDAKPALVVLNSVTAGLAAELDARCLLLDHAEVAEAVRTLPGRNLTDEERGAVFSPDQPAYVIYTSGSTGVPKGVVVRHSGVVNLVAAMVDRLGSGPGTRTLQFASSSFDAFVGEMTQSLLNGGTLVSAAAERLTPGPDLTRLVTEKRINDLVLPPSALEVMSPQEWPGGTTVSIVGEAGSPAVIERWSPVCTLINGYGPTEATVSTAMSTRLSPSQADAPPIGRPLRNVRVYVLDDRMELVPAGAVGELYVGGAGVTLGYLGRDVLTAERFGDDPFAGPGARLYRTGDLVRWTADGELTFVGRNDDQVKVRGFRIELGEIEAALARSPGVAGAAATVWGDQPGDRRLVAYVVADPGAEPDPERLRARLAAGLPAHLVPSVITRIAGLPRTASGKLDRRALPPPQQVTAVASRPPVSAHERLMVELFAAILGAEPPGIDDSFFDLGGHSLSAVRLLARIRKTVGVELTVRELFDAPTPAGLAGLVDDALRKQTETS